VTSEGVPYKYATLEHPEAVKYTGLLYDLFLFTKKILDNYKSTPNNGNMCIRLRLKSSQEVIINQGIYIM